jgi:hypothetical protein
VKEADQLSHLGSHDTGVGRGLSVGQASTVLPVHCDHVHVILQKKKKMEGIEGRRKKIILVEKENGFHYYNVLLL